MTVTLHGVDMSSSIMRYVDKLRGHSSTLKTRHNMGETKMVVVESVESIGTGAVLGMADAKLKGGLDQGGVPVDFAAGALLTVGSVALPAKAQTRDTIRRIGGLGMGIGTFRMTSKWAGGKHSTAHGEIEDAFDDDSTGMGADPILNAAANL